MLGSIGAIFLDVKRICNTSVQDKRLRAAAIAFILPSLWFGLFESFTFFDEKNSFSVVLLMRYLGLALVVYVFADLQQYKVIIRAII